jgi:manganese transport protein
MQLGFAVIPLIHAVRNKEKMGSFRLKTGWTILAWICAFIIVGLNVKLVTEEIASAYESFPQHTLLFHFTILPLALFSAGVLLYITFVPFIKGNQARTEKGLHGEVAPLNLAEADVSGVIAVAVDFSSSDALAIRHALSIGNKKASLVLIHSVETAGALMLGREIKDDETRKDQEQLASYVSQIMEQGIACTSILSYGRAANTIPKAVEECGAGLLVMAAHGHDGWKDFLFGTTINKVRHRIKIPVHIVTNPD